MFTTSKYLRTRLPEIVNVINSVLPKPEHNVTITQEMEIDSDECNDLEVIQEVLYEKWATPSWADTKDGNSKAEPPVTVKMPSAPVIVSRPAAPYDPNRTCSSCGEIGHFKRNCQNRWVPNRFKLTREQLSKRNKKRGGRKVREQRQAHQTVPGTTSKNFQC
ncbi:unnamed protein product [Allacma fusca]|uniref:CCHC-type domain-containing protein n=1 Tax=Allacma fusca TaxID=39272 RepID=A0A8J2LC28_9HEXA|nr:unnamed protein product [Allacma fusca]